MRRPHTVIMIPNINKSPDAFVHTRVELFYRRFLEEVDTEYHNDADLFDAHIKAIIWGVLYIEGLVNHKLYEFTTTKFSRRDLIDGYWELTKQARIEDKIDLVFSLDRVKRSWLKEHKKKFMKMVAERNRLVHFKEVPTPIDLPALVAKLGVNAPSSKWIEHTPYSKFITEILSEPLHNRVQIVTSLGDALERLDRSGYPVIQS
jgi:hypothetical protein